LSVARDAAGKVSCREHPVSEFNPAELKMKLPGRAGQVEFGGEKFRWKRSAATGFKSKLEIGNRKSKMRREFFDADKIGGEIVLRHWRPGDRFQPIGLKSAAKLQDLFVNAKIPAARRRGLVLAATVNGEIFWVETLRIGEKFKLTPETKVKFGWNCSKGAS
jgi:tRNA(Ile)-lysidine synthase